MRANDLAFSSSMPYPANWLAALAGWALAVLREWGNFPFALPLFSSRTYIALRCLPFLLTSCQSLRRALL